MAPLDELRPADEPDRTAASLGLTSVRPKICLTKGVPAENSLPTKIGTGTEAKGDQP
jgi:hypothetical protein